MDLQEHYDGYYHGTSEWRELSARDKSANVRELWSRVSDDPPRSVLEVGCGEGAVLSTLAAGGWPVRGIEISASGVAAAQGRGLDVEVYDGVTVPADDSSIDLVVLTHVMEHLPDPRGVLQELARVGRYIAIEVPLEYRIRTPRDFRWTEVGHINLYTMKLARQLLQSTGLTVLEEITTNPQRAVFLRSGKVKGGAQWAVREAALRVAPRVAQTVFTYHGAFLCSPASLA